MQLGRSLTISVEGAAETLAIDKQKTDGERGMPSFDGTVASASRIYQMHPRSHFHKVKSNTRRTYTQSLKLIEQTVGKRLIRNLTFLDVEHWYEQWRKPAEAGGTG